MNILSFPLNIRLNATRPIFIARICGKRLICMLDTGAHIPVFCSGNELFNVFSHNIPDVGPCGKISVGGFGQIAETAILYNFGKFSLSDNTTSINFLNCKIAVLDKMDIPCDLILPMSLFLKSRVILDYAAQKQMLRLEFSRDVYGVGYYAPKNSIYVFSQ